MNTSTSPRLYDGYTECFGAMGSGKSYLYKALLGETDVTSGRGVFLKEVFADGLDWRRPLRTALETAIYLLSTDRTWFFNYKKYLKQGGVILPDAQDLMEYVRAYFQHFNADEETINKRWGFLCDACCQYSVAVRKQPQDRRLIFDEFILQRCLSFALMLDEPADFIAGYIERAPCPKKLIVVTVDKTTSSLRISQRKKRHSVLEQERAYFCQWLILEELKKKGVNVLQLKGDAPVGLNVQLVKDFF